MTVYERLQKIIEKGLYNDKDWLINNLSVYEELKVITEDEKQELIKLIDSYPSSDDFIQNNYNNNIYLLLERQINKQVYSFSEICEMIVNLHITKTIDEYQLSILCSLIKEKYSYMYIDEQINNKGDNDNGTTI